MSRIAITDEQRIEEHIATASREELASLIRAATLVIRAKFPDAAPTKPAVKRTRGPGKSKTVNGAEAGTGAGAQTASTLPLKRTRTNDEDTRAAGAAEAEVGGWRAHLKV